MTDTEIEEPPDTYEEIPPPPAADDLRPGLFTRPLGLLHESPENPRQISDERFDALCYSLQEDPAMMNARPIIALPSGEVVAGNMRLRALHHIGVGHGPVYVEDLSPARRREWMLRDNQEYGDWVPEEVAAIMAAHADEDEDLRLLGFSERAVDDLIDLARKLEAEDDDEPEEPTPEPPASPTTRLGEIWQLGDHRLACGSSVDAALVGQLIASGDEPPLLIATDPPYGVELEMEWRDDAGFNSERFKGAKDMPETAIRGRKTTHAAEQSYLRETGKSTDVRADWSEAYDLIPSAVVAYVWHADRYVVPVVQGLEEIGFRYVQSIIWDKEVLVLSRTVYHFRHEPCALAVRRGHKIPFHGKQDQHTIWAALSPKRIGKASDEEKMPHPAQKPVSLFEIPARNHLRRGEALYDPFMGSGTAMMAAERSGRRAFGVELSEAYCDVAIERWENATGGKAKRLHAP